MIAKFVIFMALFYSVQASAVVRKNIFAATDAAEVEVSLPVRNCDDSACDSFCKQHDFVGGYCSGDMCMCRINGQAKERDYADSTEVEVSLPVRNCDDSACDSFCKQHLFVSGYCSGDMCMCRINGQAKELDYADATEVEVSLPVHNCDNSACDSFCKQHRFVGGYCSGDTCMCRINGQAKKIDYASKKLLVLQSCDNGSCDHLCRRLGFTGGVCAGDQCKCDINNGLLTATVIFDSLEDCDSNICKQSCQNLGYWWGTCSGGECYCIGFKNNLKNALQNKKSNTPKATLVSMLKKPKLGYCDSTICYITCQLQNESTGYCIAGSCVCI